MLINSLDHIKNNQGKVSYIIQQSVTFMGFSDVFASNLSILVKTTSQTTLVSLAKCVLCATSVSPSRMYHQSGFLKELWCHLII